MTNLAKLVVSLTTETAQYSAGLRQANQQIQRFERSTTAAVSGIQKTLSGIPRALAGAVGGIGLAALARDSVNAAVRMESVTAALQQVTGNAANTALVMEDLRTQSDRLGLSFPVMVSEFTKFAASAKNTRLEGAAARDVFLSIAEAGARMGLSTDQTSGALLAVQQIISKGTVSAEELRGQLGERLPGAFQIAARAMGVTTAELGSLLQKGEVVSDDFLPRFAAELRRTFGTDINTRIDTTQAQFERLRNVFNDLQRQVGGPLASGLASAGQAALQFSNQFGGDAIAVAMVAATVAVGRLTAGLTALAASQARAVYSTVQQSAVNVAGAKAWAGLTAANAASTAATINDTKATLAAVTAARAEYVAKLQQANAAAVAARATLQETAATLAQGNVVQRTLQGTLALAQATRARTVAINELAILGTQQARLEAQLAAATTANAAAQARATAAAAGASAAIASTTLAARAAAGAMGVLRGALAFLGGPIGAVVTGLTLLYFWFQKNKDGAEEAAASMKRSLSDLAGEARRMQSGQPILSEEQKAAIEDGKKQLAQLARAYGELAKVRDSLAQQGRVADVADVERQMAEVQTRLKSVADDIQTLNGVAAQTPPALEGISNAGAGIEKVGKAARVAAASVSQYDAVLELHKKMAEEDAERQQVLNDKIAEAGRVFDATRTPLEQFNAEIARLNDLRNTFVNGAPLIDQQTYTRAVIAAQDQLAGVSAGVRQAADDTDDAAKRMSIYAERAAENMQDAFADFLFDPFSKGLDGMLADFEVMLRRMAAQAAASEIFESFDWGGALGGLVSAGFSAIGGVPGTSSTGTYEAFNIDGLRAAGGPVSRGNLYMVGEEGPELFMADRSGSIVPNHELAAAGNTTININIPISAPSGTVGRQTLDQVSSAALAGAQRAMRRNR